MGFRKAFLFGTLSLFSVASTTGAEQPQKDNFEAVVKHGYYDFLDRVGQEKSKELGLEDPIEQRENQKKTIIREIDEGIADNERRTRILATGFNPGSPYGLWHGSPEHQAQVKINEINYMQRTTELVKQKMAEYQILTGIPHPRWDEFSKM